MLTKSVPFKKKKTPYLHPLTYISYILIYYVQEADIAFFSSVPPFQFSPTEVINSSVMASVCFTSKLRKKKELATMRRRGRELGRKREREMVGGVG